MVQFGRADYWSGDDRFREQPSQRYLRAGNAPRSRDFGNTIDDGLVQIDGFREETPVSIVSLGANTSVIGVPAQPAARLRAPRNDADPFCFAERQHFPLLLAVEKVYQVLHADKPGPAVQIGNAECAGELPSMHRRRTDVAGLACLDDVVQSFESLLDRRVVIPAVDLVQIDIVGAETAQAGVD